MRFQWAAHKLVWNLSGGRLMRKVGGMPVVELVTVGHKSGQERQILISYVDDRGAPALIGTNAGRNTDPAWVKNLRANPEARARWNGKWHDVRGVELDGDDHARVWEQGVAVNPGYAEYRQDLTRPVPIVRLESR
jgi:deazaflavin-dependent oxidoreductase (nitroreductase family)